MRKDVNKKKNMLTVKAEERTEIMRYGKRKRYWMMCRLRLVRTPRLNTSLKRYPLYSQALSIICVYYLVVVIQREMSYLLEATNRK